MTELISAVVNNPRMKKLSPTAITNWLVEKGFLEKQTDPDGKTKRLPTRSGIQLGLFIATRQGMCGEYQAVFTIQRPGNLCWIT